LAASAANQAGLGLYRNMRWFIYHDLVRYVKINPKIKTINIKNVVKQVLVNIDPYINERSHYLKQPGIKGLELNDGSVVVSQEEVGGLRVVDIKDVKELEKEAWSLGYLWMDFITSWNNLKIKQLEANNWTIDYKSVVPWRLNPVEENYFCDITFLSENPIDNEFIVHRSFSDHGRVGSIKNIHER